MKEEEIRGKRVLETGSKYVNGSVRPFVKLLCPKEYIGIDLEHGKYVDLVLPAEKSTDYFGEERFDAIVSTELLEHVRDWRIIIENMKRVLKPNGYIYLTTRSKGFPFHAYPYDFWRYEVEDVQKIFSDFNIIRLQKDWQRPGLFLKATKPKNYAPNDISNIVLYSMIHGKRTVLTSDINDMPFSRKGRLLSHRISQVISKGLLKPSRIE